MGWQVLFAALAMAPFAFVAVGMMRGRIKARACCAIADPERDVRMAGVESQTVAQGEGSTTTRSPILDQA